MIATEKSTRGRPRMSDEDILRRINERRTRNREYYHATLKSRRQQLQRIDERIKTLYSRYRKIVGEPTIVDVESYLTELATSTTDKIPQHVIEFISRVIADERARALMAADAEANLESLGDDAIGIDRRVLLARLGGRQ